MKKKPRVTSVRIARLYNTGRYEHIKYELSADVPEGASAVDTLVELKSIINRLRPLPKPFGYDSARILVAKPADLLTEQEKARLEEATETVKTFEAEQALRWDAIKRLDALGGTSVKKEAAQIPQDFNEEPY